MTNTAKNTADKGLVVDALTADEKKRLFSAEATIRNGQKAFYNIGRALTDIAQFRLYRATHSTFAKYAKEKWDMTTARVSQYQAAYRIHALLTAADIKPLPASESQCRPLVRIPADENMDARISSVWNEVVNHGDNITAKLVNDMVDAELGIEKKAADSTADADALTAAEKSAGNDAPSAAAEQRAEVRELKRKIAYLESALAAEKAAHKVTAAKSGLPQSAMAKQLFKAGYRAIAKAAHPDNGGTPEKMAELTALKTALNI